MKIWKVLAPGTIAAEERPDNIQTATQAKVKVTKLLLSAADMRVFGGGAPSYPVIPGRYAVGIVSEAGAECVSVEKNTHVYLNDMAPCGQCEQCIAGKPENCVRVHVAGTDCDGYLRDFIVTDESNLSPLPPSVSDEEALFIGIVSMCEAVIDRLNVSKGMHVAVFGAGEIGNILSQLLIYHQAVPILIDEDEEKLKAAAGCGIYYTFKADETLGENIARITGGRMAAGSVFNSYSPLAPELPFMATTAGGTVVYTGFGFPERTVQLKAAQDKRLTLTTVTNDYTNNETAINLLVNKAVNLAPFLQRKNNVANLEQVFTEEEKHMQAFGYARCSVIDML